MIDSEEAIILYDKSGSIILWSNVAERLYGWVSSLACRPSISDIFPNEERITSQYLIDELMENSAKKIITSKRLTKDKRILDVKINVTILKNSSGEILSIVAKEQIFDG